MQTVITATANWWKTGRKSSIDMRNKHYIQNLCEIFWKITTYQEIVRRIINSSTANKCK